MRRAFPEGSTATPNPNPGGRARLFYPPMTGAQLPLDSCDLAKLTTPERGRDDQLTWTDWRRSRRSGLSALTCLWIVATEGRGGRDGHLVHQALFPSVHVQKHN